LRASKIVDGHIGYPWTQEAVAVAAKRENVSIGAPAYTVARHPAATLADAFREIAAPPPARR